MATPFTDTPKVGADLVGYVPTADLASGAQKSNAALGSQVLGSDGRLYVYARANASIAASDTDCSISASTFLATASGGSYRSPAFALVTGDEAWFSKASV
jgi:hypothetical protein